MPLLAVPFESVLLDHLVTIASAYSAAQVALPGGSALGFTAERDRLDSVNDDDVRVSPKVIFYADSIQSDGPRVTEQGVVSVVVEMYVASLETVAGDGDKAALARLYYLKEQVKAALWNLVSVNLGFGAGTCGNPKWGRFQTFKPNTQTGELWGIGGTLSFDVAYSWNPEDIATPTLDQVSVVTGMWSGLYNV